MKLIRLEWYSGEHGCCYSWHASKKEAEADKKAVLEYDDVQGGFEITEVEVPTTKKRLAQWLSVHLNTDNG